MDSFRTSRGQPIRSRLQYSILFPKSPSPQRRQDVVPRSNPFHLYSRLFRVRPDPTLEMIVLMTDSPGSHSSP
jgi:hypothetical protein